MEIKEEIYGDNWILSSKKVAFFPRLSSMFVADLHLGKLTHFRNSGIGLPTKGEQYNFRNLQLLFSRYKPRQVYFLGDLFHSSKNVVWDEFRRFITENSGITFILILGNHDTFIGNEYDNLPNLDVNEWYMHDKFILTHEPIDHDKIPDHKINICGHIHPAVILKGKGKQKLRLSCFLFRPNQLIMPAFGEFTGNFVVEPSKNDTVVVLAQNEIFRIY